MSLAPTVFKSTDSGAPVVTGQAGSLVAMLDAILVNGYGSKSPLGWSIEYTATNKRVYRGDLDTGSGYFLRVDDTFGVTAGIRGYASMSDIDTGTDVFPTLAERANGMLWQKSGAANATARNWVAIGNDRCFYLSINHLSRTPAGSEPLMFAGDLLPATDTDLHCFAISRTTVTSTSSGDTYNAMLAHSGNVRGSSNNSQGLVVAKSANGISVAVNGHVCALGNPAGSASNQGINGNAVGYNYPEVVTGALMYCRTLLNNNTTLRAWMPGMYMPLHPTMPTDLQEIPNIDGMPPGTTFMVKRLGSGGWFDAGFNSMLFDITNPWE